MARKPAILDTDRPDVPDIVVSGGILPFYLPGRPVRGRLIRLGAVADALLTRHDYPPPVAALSGQALALVAGLSSALKFSGSFSLQAKGNGPVSMLLADCNESGALRGYARVDIEKLTALQAHTPEPTASELLGTGHMMFTVDQHNAEDSYQGIVAIEGDTLADMALHYFNASEQLRCHVMLSCARTPTGWRASALTLEKIAGEGGIVPDETMVGNESDDEAWHTAITLACTATHAELLSDDLSSEELVYRLFGTEDAAVNRPRALAYGCRCSRAKLYRILNSMPPDDLDEITETSAITMTCEFCNIDFAFPRADFREEDET